MDVREFLKNIKSPNDIKKLNEYETVELIKEIRNILVETVSKNGGHLASNLGTVELTVALCKVFDFEKDNLVWDVGHQCYTYKLLTGRYSQFDTLRTENGISGFPRPDESRYDTFYAGHSGTSVSSAYGLAAAKKIMNDNSTVIDVIGDGSFTNGMVYEALNNAGKTKSNLIVILNDNKMSISRNVGAFSKYLTAVRSKRKYFRLKASTERLLNHIPFIGHKLSKLAYRIKVSIKNIIYGSNLFEDLGFKYMGPVDGHNIKKLCELLELAKEENAPVLLHINTKKGKGYDFAEKSPSLYHGVSKFDMVTGEALMAENSFSTELGRIICEIAEKNNRVCAITAAMKSSTGLNCFSEKYPDRFFDVGIAEEHAISFACGLAKNGMIPIVDIYSTFLQRCYDQLIHDGALQKQKMIIIVDRAGFVGEDGETHQGIFDVSMINSIPNAKIFSPASYNELEFYLKNAVDSKDNCLHFIRIPRGSEVNVTDFSENTFDVLGDESCEICVVTYGRLFSFAEKSIEMLQQKGIRAKIVKLNRIKPFDTDVFKCVKECEKIFFFEECIKSGSIGESFSEFLIENGYKGYYKHCAVDNEFVMHASVDSQLKKYNLDSEGIFGTVYKECL